jgi:hypothetical protein
MLNVVDTGTMQYDNCYVEERDVVLQHTKTMKIQLLCPALILIEIYQQGLTTLYG